MFGSDIDFKSKTVGEAFEDFFQSPSWNGFVSDKGKKVAEFDGKAELMGNTVKIEFQFSVNDDDTFEVAYFGIDGDSAPQIMGEGLIGKVFE
ncbi:MAG: hypothetical protein CMI30_12160 [Opitutae bacterium]|nr:hypothetical protein [Opitutae bacterium]